MLIKIFLEKYLLKKFSCFLILFLSSVSLSFGDIDDGSFSNDGKYALLKNTKLSINDVFDLKIQFIPPTGKKVNSASYVKVWEKQNGNWILAKRFSAEDKNFNQSTNTLNATLNFKTNNLPAALEVEFIYCNKDGSGQCDMERYLTKIVRQKEFRENVLNLKLKI